MRNPTPFDDRFWAKFLEWARQNGLNMDSELHWRPWFNCFAAGNVASLEVRNGH